MDSVQRRLLVKKLLEQAAEQEVNRAWQIQGFGMLRLYLSKEVRLHVWHNGLVYHDTPSNIHDHPWDFISTVVVGALRNTRYEAAEGQPSTHHLGRILCGPGGGLLPNTVKDIHLLTLDEELVKEGDSYTQVAKELHTMTFQNGTVTLVTRVMQPDPDHAQVAWLKGQTWKTAEPRLATQAEVQLGVKAALSLF